MGIDIERLKHDADYWDEVARGRGCVSPVTAATICGIPSPTKPSAPEWDGEGLPPVGCECEVLMGSYWYRCEVLGRSDEALWVKAHDRQDYWTIMNGPSISVRPIRTKEQRLRDELVDMLHKKRPFTNNEQLASAILSRYNLEPKE